MREQYKQCLVKLKFSDLHHDLELVDNGTDIIVKNFKYGSKKVNIYLPYGITVLGDSCFSGTDVEQVHLCSSITQVGYGCFANCPKLRLVTLHESQVDLIPHLKLSNNADFVVRTKICRHGDV